MSGVAHGVRDERRDLVSGWRRFAGSLGVVWFLLAATSMFAQDAVDKPLPPDEAARTMTVPEGFRVTLFAGEPDVVQPIAMTTDDRGRVWVAECLSYPKWEETGNDRIVILTDSDGDGDSDQRTVFAEGLANVSGVQVGFGGVWVMATPYLLFIPDRNEDGVADGPAEKVLDGWDLKAKHNVASALTWGPDGWLYAANGILSNSFPAKPGTPHEQRSLFNCGVWRYHPTRQLFEPVAWGTTNPWGIDFDEYGQLFGTNCVIAHLWHFVPGGHYQRMFGQDVNPHSYSLLPTIAEHLHWGGGAWQESRTGKVHDEAGGGHAHCGAMIYLGDNWPAEYRGGIFMCNIHGRRINHNRLVRTPEGYIGKRAPDVIRSQDPWFRGTAVMMGHDGGVYIADWSDAGECHDYEDIHRDNGRIFKVTYGTPQAAAVDLRSLSDTQLLDLQTSTNEWMVRHARRRLHERIADGKLTAEGQAALKQRHAEAKSALALLRYQWCDFRDSGKGQGLVSLPLDHADENVRAWAIRLQVEDRSREPEPAVVAKLVGLAKTDPSPFVRLHLASALQRLPRSAAWAVATELSRRSEDVEHQWINHLLWWGIEPHVAAQPDEAMATFATARSPFLRECVARRLETHPAVVKSLAATRDTEIRRSLLKGMGAAIEGRRDVQPPKGWGAVAEQLLAVGDEDLSDRTMALSLQFGDETAIRKLEALPEDTAAPLARRQAAVRSLAVLKRAALKPLFLRWLQVKELQGACLPALSVYDDPAIAAAILSRYSAFSAEEKLEAIAILAARSAWTMSLYDALDAKQVPRGDISLTVARQLANSKDEAVRTRLGKSWGVVRDTAGQRRELITKYKSEMTPDVLAKADLSRGKALFTKTCATCHVLHGEGQRIGPELTGAQRTSLDYLLENVLDPSAVVATDYMNWLIETTDGRSLAGVVIKETASTVTVQLPNGQTIIPVSDIESKSRLGTSLMPEGLLDPLSPTDIRDLLGFVMKP
jgi:putative membrane-bound dehydrogenase-like protein